MGNPTTKSVLVVDDRLEAADALAQLLHSLGLRAVGVYSATEAFAHLKHTKVDIILLDIEMPKTDGYQFATMIRKEMNLTIPIIALTGYSYEEVSQKAKAHSIKFAAILTKPIDMKELNKMLHTVLS